MRRYRDPSQLRRTYVGSMPWSTQKRNILEKHPRGRIMEESSKPATKKFPTVELPDIVLDLDAENSPYARPFSVQDAAQQQAKWAKDIGVDEALSQIRNLRQNLVKDGKMMRSQASSPNTMQSISDYDVLAIALLGGSAVSSSLEYFDLRENRSQRCRPISFKGLRRNGIPTRILAGDANKVIPFMLHRQQLARTEEDAGGLEALTLSIRHVQTLSQLRKLCAGRTRVSEQIWTSQASIDHIVHTLRSLPPQPSASVLTFVNNFTIRQLSENTGLNASMSLHGLEIASRLNLLSPIVQYLQICLSQGFIGSDDKGAKKLETGRGILIALERGQGTARGTRPELFTLLTGRSLDNSELQPALFGLERLQNQEKSEVHLIYVRLLAELGALRLLWYAWREDLETVDVNTFIRCVEVLSSAKGDASVDHTTVTGDLEKDADLDLLTINSLDAYHTSATRARTSYAANLKYHFSAGEVRQAYESANIHQAMVRFGNLISRSVVVIQSNADTQSDADDRPE